ncbi:clip-associated protein [Anaeramoeba ignava]|uniref:Clip-associated protein n=1 Tax=Anaeramoeba ignava TaxID=1746090 RepID=A0A9Q0R9A2_ANAIG|nr:clip-associated protein [Anaeramoeba ignava]
MSRYIKTTIKEKKKEKPKVKKLVDVDWDKVGEKYDALDFNSIQELEEKIEEMKQNLEKEDWELRKHAILQFHKILNGNAVKNYEEFPRLLNKLEGIFGGLLADEHKAVVKHTTFVVAHLSRKLGKNFGGIFAKNILPGLVRILTNSDGKIKECGDWAIKTTIKNTASGEIAREIKEMMTNGENDEFEKQLAGYGRLILHTWGSNEVEDCVNEMSEVVECALKSKDAETRRLGSRAFWELTNHSVSDSRKIFEKMDSRLQKLILGQKHPDNNPRNKIYEVIKAETSTTGTKTKTSQRSRSLVNKQSVLRARTLKPKVVPKTETKKQTSDSMPRVMSESSVNQDQPTKNRKNRSSTTVSSTKEKNKTLQHKSSSPTLVVKRAHPLARKKSEEKKTKDKQLKKLITEVNSSDFSSKINGLQSLLEISKQQNNAELANGKMFKTALSAVARAMAHNQTKSRVLCLEILREMLDNYTKNFQTNILVALNAIVLLDDKQDQIKETVEDISDLMRTTLGISVLAPALVKTLEKSSPTSKPLVLDYMIKIFSAEKSDYFREASATKNIISALRPLVKIPTLEIKKKNKKILQILKEKNEDELMKQIQSQSKDDRKNFLALLTKAQKTKPVKNRTKRVVLSQKTKIVTKQILSTETSQILNSIKSNISDADDSTTHTNENEGDAGIESSDKDQNHAQKILLQLNDPLNRASALASLLSYSTSKNISFWESAFSPVLFELFKIYFVSEPQLQKEILSLVVSLSTHQENYFKIYTKEILHEYFRICALSQESTVSATFDLMLPVLPVLEPSKALSSISSFLTSDSNSVLLASITLFGKLSHHLQKDLLQKNLDTIYPLLKSNLDKSNSEIRKAVIFTFIDVYKVIGDDFIRNRLAKTLKMSQLKLIVEYIQKEKSKN